MGGRLSQLLPDDEDVARYRERGWYVSQKVVPAEVLDEAAFAVGRYYAGERDHPLPISGGFLNWVPEHGDVLRINDYVSLQNDALRALVTLPILGQIAARLTGSPAIRLFHDQLITKPPELPGGETAVGWHVDRAYWHTCTSTQMLTIWIPFDDCTPEMGPLMVIDRSCRWPGNESMKTFNDRDLDRVLGAVQSGGQPIVPVTMALERGQVSFHHCLTVHGSAPNRSDRPRTALTVHLQDAANRYAPRADAHGRRALHINDLLCRADESGYPDYTDPDICPVLWPVPGEEQAVT